MTIPKYVREILQRTKYSFTDNSVPGYTIAIEKRTQYAYHTSLYLDAKRLVDWANREYRKLSKDNTAIATINSYPAKTVFKYKQYAIVTIFDPIMKNIEQYIAS